MNKSRRNFLKTAGIVSAGFMSLQAMLSQELHPAEKLAKYGYGPLQEDPEGILNLPDGFTYKIISKQGEKMADGLLTPGKADGMAAFALDKGRTILIRNHEIEGPASEGAFGKNYELLKKVSSNKLYDYGRGDSPGLGGTTSLIYNTHTQEVELSYMSLAGTIRNCAGGPTPWNSWISCEETVMKAGKYFEKDHGYNFEVPASKKVRLADPIPLKAMGRFNHEAVAVDPRTSIVYQTEDRNDGLIYRFLPKAPRKLARGGDLQVLAVKGRYAFDTRNWKTVKSSRCFAGEKMEVMWMDIDDVESPHDDLRKRGFDKGATKFARGEGMWFGNNEVYFACTNGGKKKAGQIFCYKPSPYEGTPREHEAPATLELFAEPNNTDIVSNCDNLTMAPSGELFLCEDNPSPRIVGVTPKGQFFIFGHNVGYESEFAGGAFSPDGSTYFVNIQYAGLTLAITGPWHWLG